MNLQPSALRINRELCCTKDYHKYTSTSNSTMMNTTQPIFLAMVVFIPGRFHSALQSGMNTRSNNTRPSLKSDHTHNDVHSFYISICEYYFFYSGKHPIF